MEYKISEYAKKNKVSIRTIWNWISDGRVSIRRTETGRIRIVIDENKEKTVAIYARVSSSENKDNLERQKERLVSFCNTKGYKVSKRRGENEQN